MQQLGYQTGLSPGNRTVVVGRGCSKRLQGSFVAGNQIGRVGRSMTTVMLVEGEQRCQLGRVACCYGDYITVTMHSVIYFINRFSIQY